jgi:3-phenylpropionate/trans-cinnamate dioxygenase ferredoxin reductase subunit
MAARRILALGLALTPDAAADPGHDLKALATGR